MVGPVLSFLGAVAPPEVIERKLTLCNAARMPKDGSGPVVMG